jgi:hypothetical protein
VHGNQWVARNDQATTKEAMEPLRAMLLGVSATGQCYGFATALARDCYIMGAIRVAPTGNFVVRSAPRLRQLSGNSVGRL